MMLTFRAGKVAALATFLFLAAACSREQQDWRSAEAADTAESYGQFLERHPESELVTQARTRGAQLTEGPERSQAIRPHRWCSSIHPACTSRQRSWIAA